MVPGKFIFVNDFPLNANGKMDKNALKQTFYNGK
jgi:non-ribosomal peptide synthetase component E (peptide arylation enzyme)